MKLNLNTANAGKICYLRGGRVAIKCEVVGTYQAGNDYIRLKLLEQDGCHLVGDIVDYGAKWVDCGTCIIVGID